MTKTLRKIDQLNTKIYDNKYTKLFDRRRKINISTREKREVQVQSIFYKNKPYPKHNLKSYIKRTMRKKKIK